MVARHAAIFGIIIAFVLMFPPLSVLAAAAEKLTMKSIVEGAKEEGKISWGTNLQEHEVAKLNKAFQKEYPFIKEVSYSRVRGAEEHERVLSEMQAGTYPYDMLHVQDELIARYTDLGFLMNPVDWKGLFGVDPRMMHPKGFGIAVGNNPTGIAYNRRRVPKERAPTKWSDCYDPFFKGKVSVDVRPSNMHSLVAGFGEEWTLDFARKLAANDPRWIRGNTQAILLVAAGEVFISCPGSHGTWYRQASRKPNFPVEFVFPDGPILAGRDLLLSPLKGSAHPNTALLLTGWIAAKGVTYLDTGRDSLFHPGTKLGAKFKQSNREIKIQSWEDIALTNQRTRKILEIWGFPKPGK